MIRFLRIWLLLLLALPVSAGAQYLEGDVVDAETGEGIAYVYVLCPETKAGKQTDDKGHFKIPYQKKMEKLTFSCVGYKRKTVKVDVPGKPILVKLEMDARLMKEVGVTTKKKKYKRKDNPAVLLMRKVIAAKSLTDLSNLDYYQYRKYQKFNFAINDFTPKVFEEGRFKKMPFLKKYVVRDEATGKLTLPVMVDETLTDHLYRKNPQSKKSIVQGHRSKGLNEWFSTGDIMNVMLQDCFEDVNIYDNMVRLLRNQFVSPISSTQAISFYRYFIADTVMVGNDRCIEVSFTPNNSQDFGFTGSLYIMADSTYRVRKVEMGVPYHSGINFVDNMHLVQEFIELPTGEYVLLYDEMQVQLELLEFLTKFQVRRTTRYSDYAFDSIPENRLNWLGDKKTAPDAMLRTDSFWEKERPLPLTKSETSINSFLKDMEAMKGFNLALFVVKAFVENFVETSKNPEKPSKIDIGPVNTIVSHNQIDGFRLRASAQTTANLDPHLFARGYVAYGFKDHRWKGLGELTYSLNKKAYLPREFPVHNLTLTGQYDVMAPSDKILPTDKDNVFTSFKWTTVDLMSYVKRMSLKYDREWANGLRLTAVLKHERDEPTGKLSYESLNGSLLPSRNILQAGMKELVTNDFTLGLQYQPGASYINTKQRRVTVNKDAPVFSLSHTIGWRGLGNGDYTYNYTELGVYKRFFLSAYGRLNMHLRGGIQWNQVPFPLLITPPSNLSYIKQEGMFNLINNMEFMSDRFASLTLSWEPNGWFFNRIPLLRKLKWREYVAYNTYWGTLTKKNNPMLEQNRLNDKLFYFPGHFVGTDVFRFSSRPLDPDVPYMEWVVGIHNIFKILCVDYVHRVNYRDKTANYDVHRWGVRIKLDFTF